ncbi:hypothetical protein B566_EDAN008798 [Ephemera danica]|nr:hypothetical protein B566_EDAN008798 [Ephemera danica]
MQSAWNIHTILARYTGPRRPRLNTNCTQHSATSRSQPSLHAKSAMMVGSATARFWHSQIKHEQQQREALCVLLHDVFGLLVSSVPSSCKLSRTPQRVIYSMLRKATTHVSSSPSAIVTVILVCVAMPRDVTLPRTTSPAPIPDTGTPRVPTSCLALNR